MVLCDDEGLAEHLRDRRDYDNRDTLAQHFPYKMTDMQAAMGRVQLQKLSGFLARRRDISLQYSDTLREVPLVLPESGEHVFFRYVVLSKARVAMERYLYAQGVEAKRPVYLPAHQYFSGEKKNARVRLQERYPVADRAHAEALSLPIHPGMTDADVNHVAQCVQRFFEEQDKDV
ncbi:MAG: DegT/DnrJ/EryC1/StrS family aminotransferase [Candidatus Hydrogenedentota bacterium]